MDKYAAILVRIWHKLQLKAIRNLKSLARTVPPPGEYEWLDTAAYLQMVKNAKHYNDLRNRQQNPNDHQTQGSDTRVRTQKTCWVFFGTPT